MLERLVARRAAVVLAAGADLADARPGTGRPRRPPGAGRRTAARDGPAATRGSATRWCSPSGGCTRRRATTRCSRALPLLGDAVVAVAGDGPLEDELRARGPGVRWLGRRDDVGDLLDAADVVVLPSVWEARSLTAQEALRAGRPLVATAVGGHARARARRGGARPPGDPAALGAAVRRLLDHPEQAAARRRPRPGGRGELADRRGHRRAGARRLRRALSVRRLVGLVVALLVVVLLAAVAVPAVAMPRGVPRQAAPGVVVVGVRRPALVRRRAVHARRCGPSPARAPSACCR